MRLRAARIVAPIDGVNNHGGGSRRAKREVQVASKCTGAMAPGLTDRCPRRHMAPARALKVATGRAWPARNRHGDGRRHGVTDTSGPRTLVSIRQPSAPSPAALALPAARELPHIASRSRDRNPLASSRDAAQRDRCDGRLLVGRGAGGAGRAERGRAPARRDRGLLARLPGRFRVGVPHALESRLYRRYVCVRCLQPSAVCRGRQQQPERAPRHESP